MFSTERWKIGTPDVVIKTPPQKIPATGYIPYRYIMLMQHPFTEDTWVQGVQILPENFKAMHHCNMFFLKAGEKPSDQNFITGQVPGGDAMILDNHVGFKIPANSILGLQIHYVTLGHETTDQISVGLKYAHEVIQKSLKVSQVTNLTFTIPPVTPHHKVAAVRELKADVTGYGMFTHMHLRGEDMTFRACIRTAATKRCWWFPTTVSAGSRPTAGRRENRSFPREPSSRSLPISTTRLSTRTIPIRRKPSKKGSRRSRR